MRLAYRLCYVFVRMGFFLWHPVFRVFGRELVPDGNVLFCANHSGMADPLWILLALNAPNMIRILAKKELRSVPFVGWLLERFNIIFVDRGHHDEQAYQKSVDALEHGQKLLIFIEGTRCSGDKHVRARTGAMRMAAQTGTPVVPIFVTRDRKPFCPVTVRFGEPYRVCGDPEDHEKMQELADETLKTIYRLGGDAYADQIG